MRRSGRGRLGDSFDGIPPAFYFYGRAQQGISVEQMVEETGIPADRIRLRIRAVALLGARSPSREE